MLTFTDTSLISADDLVEFVKVADRTATEWIKAHGGRKVCGKWMILGERLKQEMLAESEEAEDDMSPAPAIRKNFQRRSL